MSANMTKRIARFIEPFRVTPGTNVKLAKDFDPGFKAGIDKKKDGVGLLNDGIALLSEYQQRLAAQATRGVVVVLQALDAAGKDGTIKHVMSGVNPQGVRVESFNIPSARELDQDFLRRYQQRLPARGEIGIFNRSHYEECWSYGCTRRRSTARSCRPRLASTMSGSSTSTRSTNGSAI
jgi:polyphosphate kinase 2 (PPK2 family)